MNTQTEFDHFYSTAIGLLDQFYPERTVTMTTRDPDFITPEIKYKLRRKNRLMRAGRVEEAGALAVRIGKDMTQHGKTRLCKIGGKVDAKEMWAAVRQLTGRQQRAGPIDGITAESLNNHYAAISTDLNYSSPIRKTAATPRNAQYITEFQVFKILDKLRPTAMGLDMLPAWFLRLGAPAFYKPIAKLFNLSLANSYVPHQWKQASILPIPKNFRPQASRRLSTDLYHTGLNSSHGADSCTTIPVSSYIVTSSYIVIHRPVCLPSNRISYSCNYQFPQHHHQHATHRPLRHSHRPGFQ